MRELRVAAFPYRPDSRRGRLQAVVDLDETTSIKLDPKSSPTPARKRAGAYPGGGSARTFAWPDTRQRSLKLA